MKQPICILIHAAPEIAPLYEHALGIPVYRILPPGAVASGSYDERTGVARDYPTLDAAVARYAPNAEPGCPVVIVAWSAGCWAARAWLRSPDARLRCRAVVLLDGMHDSGSGLGGVEDFAAMAMADPSRALVVTHSAIKTTGYPDTTKSASAFLRRLGVPRASDRESVHHGGLHVLAYASGAWDKEAHVEHVREIGPRVCADIVRPLLPVHDTEPAPPPSATDPSPQHLRALDVCLEEARAFGCDPDRERSVSSVVPPKRVADYLRGCTRNGSDVTGRWLAGEVLSGKHYSFCAGAQGWAADQAARPDEQPPPHRAAVREIREDAQQGRHGRWLPIESVRAGEEFPGPGSLAIYWRDSPTSGLGHVDRVLDRVIESSSDGCRTVGANEAGGRWVIEPLSYDQHNLLGFVVYDGESGIEPQPEVSELDVDWCEPIPLESTPQSRWAARDEEIRQHTEEGRFD